MHSYHFYKFFLLHIFTSFTQHFVYLWTLFLRKMSKSYVLTAQENPRLEYLPIQSIGRNVRDLCVLVWKTHFLGGLETSGQRAYH